ncbi:ATP-dependent Clp protease adaptor ClpS [Marinoscillum pacificum]|uniref:ATP-dependent Clp protease adaptor ClpS n=1 Tax=Marinoscillum pacificum TaxID=392723 RepID=UPI0021587E68|nr:ATP-dependent Clp protease adaptor ClpS [Marinoscillum pacificum]
MMLEMEFAPEVEELVEVEEDYGQDDLKNLVVHNDNFNTFDHVINTLIKVCKHDVQQAEQCTYLIHYKGKCSVKNGSFNELKPMKEGITDAGISATIE